MEDTTYAKEHLGDIKIAILQKRRSYLCKYLNPSAYMPYLRSKFILSEDDQSQIESKIGRRRQAEALLDILEIKGSEGYERLTKAIQLDKTQSFLVTQMQKFYEEEKNKYLALFQGRQLGDNTVTITTGNLPKPPSKGQSKTSTMNDFNDVSTPDMSIMSVVDNTKQPTKISMQNSVSSKKDIILSNVQDFCQKELHDKILPYPSFPSLSSSSKSLHVALHHQGTDPCEHPTSPDGYPSKPMTVQVNGEEVTLMGPPSGYIPLTISSLEDEQPVLDEVNNEVDNIDSKCSQSWIT